MKPVPAVLDDWKFHHEGRWRPARSPGCIHTDLLRHRLIGDPFWGAREKELAWIGERDWAYRTEVRLPRADAPLELVAHGLDTLAEVRLDGKLLGRTDNMFRRHAWDVRAAADGKKHRLDVVFRSVFPEIRRRSRHHDFAGREWCDPVGGCSTVRKSQCNFDISCLCALVAARQQDDNFPALLFEIDPVPGTTVYA
jgi:beta-mannosidase